MKIAFLCSLELEGRRDLEEDGEISICCPSSDLYGTITAKSVVQLPGCAVWVEVIVMCGLALVALRLQSSLLYKHRKVIMKIIFLFVLELKHRRDLDEGDKISIC